MAVSHQSRTSQIRMLGRLVRFRVAMSPMRRRSRYHPRRRGFWPMWFRANRRRPRIQPGGDVVAILLVHKRPGNLDLQIRQLMGAPSVSRIVVSGNNPDVDPGAWCTVVDDALTFRTDLGRNQTRRYAIAAENASPIYVLLDDDIFFEPTELERLFQLFRDDPTNPLGVMGQAIRSDGSWVGAITDAASDVDVLNRMYICSDHHVKAVFGNAETLGWSEEELFSNPADDVLVSFAGPGSPTVVLAEFVDCLSHNDAGIATFRQPGFHEARSEWVAGLRRHRERSKSS